MFLMIVRSFSRLFNFFKFLLEYQWQQVWLKIKFKTVLFDIELAGTNFHIRQSHNNYNVGLCLGYLELRSQHVSICIFLYQKTINFNISLYSISFISNLQSLSLLLRLFLLTDTHLSFRHPIHKRNQPLKHRQQIISIQINDHPYRHRITTKFINVAYVDELDTFTVSFPGIGLFLAVKEVSDVIWFFNKKTMCTWDI